MPIDAFLFGGRRATAVPLVHEAFDWEHGVFMGATMSSETTAAAAGDGRRAALRPDGDAALLRLQHGRLLRPLAGHRRTRGRQAAAVFYVNWFRKDADGKFLWPGFGENSRVLEWIFRRCEGTAEAVETPIGLLPAPGAIDTAGLDISEQAMAELLKVDADLVRQQLPQVKEHLAKFGEKLPAEITAQLRALEERLG